MKIELKNIRINEQLSEETYCYSATIYVDGKRVGTTGNRGHGGGDEIHFDDREFGKKVEAHVKAMPKRKYDDGMELDMDLELLFGDLLDQHKERQWFKRNCRGKTLFRVKGDKPESWRVLKAPFTPQIAAHIREKYGDQLERIANESL